MSEDIKPINEFRKVDTAKGNKDIHAEALIRFKQIVAREEESRILAVEDLIFLDQEGGQYDDGFGSTGFLSGLGRNVENDEPPPPKYQIDRISPVIEQAVSDQREAQINILVRATGESGDKGLSDTYNGLIKNIETVSDAQDAYDNSYDECQKSGYGGWQVVTEYADDSFEQNIRIEPILNATQSLFFGPAKKKTKSDALYAFHIWDIDMDEFKIQYPDAEKTDWPTESLTDFNRAWFNSRDNLIRLAAYWRKKPVKKEIVKLAPTQEFPQGRVIDADKLQPGMQIMIKPDGEEMRRSVDTYNIERYIMNGVEIVKGPQKWAGKFIPLIPQFGVRSIINGREIVRGKVRKGKDPQLIYNYMTDAIVEASAKSPNEFTWVTPAQAEGYVDDYEKANIDKPNFLYYNPDIEAPGPPVKSPGPTVQQALIEQRVAAKEDISASVGQGVGVGDGTSADTRSGEAIREGNVNTEKGNSIYVSNHISAIAYTGVILTDLMSKIMTEQRQERIIKPDGTEEFVTINQTVIDPSSLKRSVINDLTQSSFDITVDVGPAYASQRQQGADQLTRLATENPAFAQHTPDLIAKNLDIPGSKELEKRLRREMVLSGQAEPTDDEREEFQIDLRQQITQELTPQIRQQVTEEANIQLINANANQLNAATGNTQAAAQLKGVEIEKMAIDIQKGIEDVMNAKMDGLAMAIDANAKLQTAMFEKLAAGIQPSIMEIDNLNSQDDIIEEQQQEVSPGPNSAQTEEFNL